jgi:hypothetical protein
MMVLADQLTAEVEDLKAEMIVAHRDKKVLEEQYLAQIIAVSCVFGIISLENVLFTVEYDSVNRLLGCDQVAGLVLWSVKGCDVFGGPHKAVRMLSSQSLQSKPMCKNSFSTTCLLAYCFACRR